MRAEANAWDKRPGDDRDGLEAEFISLGLRDVAREYLGASGIKELTPIGDGMQIICRSGSSIADDSSTLSANVIPTPSGRSFVATAMPNTGSMHDMLTAMVDKRAQSHPLYQKSDSNVGQDDVVIVQLTNNRDGANSYLPTDSGVIHTYEPDNHKHGNTYNLRLLDRVESGGVISSEVKVTTTDADGHHGEDLNLHHLQYTLWPDCGVPEDPETLVDLVEHVNSIHDRVPASQIWVHCMAGAGRTGTFISLASLLSNPLAKPKSSMLPLTLHHSDPVYATVDSIRDFRGRQVLTPGQLGLIHDIVDSKNGVPFSSVKRRPSESSNSSIARSCATEASNSEGQSTTATATVAVA